MKKVEEAIKNFKVENAKLKEKNPEKEVSQAKLDVLNRDLRKRKL